MIRKATLICCHGLADSNTGSVLVIGHRARDLVFDGKLDSPQLGDGALLTYTEPGGPTYLAVLDAFTGDQIGGSILLRGTPAHSAILSDNGFRALIITDTVDTQNRPTTTLTTINLLTGSPVGEPLVLNGQLDSVQYNQDLASAYVIAERAPTSTTPAGTTTVVVFNTTTGIALSTTPVTATGQFDSLAYNPTRTRALLTTTDTTHTYLTIIDTDTGTLVGQTIT
jgi:hypothetical protein